MTVDVLKFGPRCTLRALSNSLSMSPLGQASIDQNPDSCAALQDHKGRITDDGALQSVIDGILRDSPHEGAQIMSLCSVINQCQCCVAPYSIIETSKPKGCRCLEGPLK
ncbi:hypothetical protein KC337_g37 [Hortaea werneckii]|nr:hypothetical protein KC337_g37 [Hortaea werneckii]